ncbi:cytochrome P450 [Musa troglodytarum]|uniref:Cytochrome P450 n=1 Tax=Musa troglodytarum TaxID=320322 RepID=A0A9E7EB23_9LILI|nr:cytochrome P450 [Musa troglodytarum]
MFGAGTDTSYITLEWAMAELIRSPRAMRKLQDEVRRGRGSGEGLVREEEVSQMAYLKAVVKEVLRLHPPAPLLLPRELLEDCSIQGYSIPKKTRVFVNAWALGRDPRSWEFADGALDFTGNDARYVPFGAGRRICPGQNFAVAALELALANLVSRFDWELPGLQDNNLQLPRTNRIQSAIIRAPIAKERASGECKGGDGLIGRRAASEAGRNEEEAENGVAPRLRTTSSPLITPVAYLSRALPYSSFPPPPSLPDLSSLSPSSPTHEAAPITSTLVHPSLLVAQVTSWDGCMERHKVTSAISEKVRGMSMADTNNRRWRQQARRMWKASHRSDGLHGGSTVRRRWPIAASEPKAIDGKWNEASRKKETLAKWPPAAADS